MASSSNSGFSCNNQIHVVQETVTEVGFEKWGDVSTVQHPPSLLSVFPYRVNWKKKWFAVKYGKGLCIQQQLDITIYINFSWDLGDSFMLELYIDYVY